MGQDLISLHLCPIGGKLLYEGMEGQQYIELYFWFVKHAEINTNV